MKVQLLYSRKVLPGKLAMGGHSIIWPGNETMTISIYLETTGLCTATADHMVPGGESPILKPGNETISIFSVQY